MKKNIIQVLKSGNQELFYSSFIAWLLDAEGEHGLEDAFLKWFMEFINEPKSKHNVAKIVPEYSKKSSKGKIRADIGILLKDDRLIVVENKTKSLGTDGQIEKYLTVTNKVVALGLVNENFSEKIQKFHKSDSLEVKIMTYSDILAFLNSTNRKETKLSVLVDEFVEYLTSITQPFITFHTFCQGSISSDDAIKELQSFIFFSSNKNDIKFFHAVYFNRLKSFITNESPVLKLGDSNRYKKKGDDKAIDATNWIIKKDIQGEVYMETLVYNPIIDDRINLKEEWQYAFKKAASKTIAIRIELNWNFEPKKIDKNKEAGKIMLGCWDNELKKEFKASNAFSKQKNVKRNFHYRSLEIDDLKYKNMVNILIEEMSILWNFKN